MASSLLGALSVFDPKISSYTVFSERLTQFFIANEITSDDRKKAILLNTLSEDCYVLLRNLCVPKTPTDLKYDELNKVLLQHFSQVKSFFSERLKFYCAKKLPDEKICEWEARVKSLAANCGFSANTSLDSLLRDIFAIGIRDSRICERIFEEDASKSTVTLSSVVKIALAKESSLIELCERSSESNMSIQVKAEKDDILFTQHELGASTSNGARPRKQNFHQANRGTRGAAGQFQEKRYQGNFSSKCSACGRMNHNFAECKYKNYICHKCGNKGHLAPVCKVAIRQNFLEPDDCYGSDQDTSEERLFNIKDIGSHEKFANNLFRDLDLDAGSVESNVKPMYIQLLVENIPINFEIDSGFAHAAISEKLYLKYFKNLDLCKNDLSLKDYIGVSFKPLGFLRLNMYYEQKCYKLKTYVIQNGGPPLIGRNGLKMLNFGICKLDKINNIVQVDSSARLKKLLQNYKEIFDGSLGTFNKFMVSLKLKEMAQPRFIKARPIPIALKPKIENEIDRLVKNNVLIPVEFSHWATPIVPILKKNGGLRICGDFKITLNPQLEVQQYPLPRVEYLFSQLEGGQKFSKIDLSEAYQQVLLDKDSTELVTISTHKGLFSYQRLPFGIHCAPSIFQNIIEQLFSNIPGVVAFLDDILVTGRNAQEHLDRLERVFEKLKGCGLKVRQEKCTFFQNSVTYMGHRIDQCGLHKTDERIEAINKVKEPTNVSELKSFLGMVNYYCKFIPNASTVLHPLYNLLKNNVHWSWSKSCQCSFKQIKDILKSPLVLTHFDPKRPIELMVDASSVGLGAIISHRYEDGSKKPIAFASRLLHSNELSYSQIEKEAAAIIFGVRKFFQYLYGLKFVLYTDHKPLLAILGDKKGLPVFAANRLQRWAYILSAFNYEIKYVTSKNNHADYLSRLSGLTSEVFDCKSLPLGDEKYDRMSYINYIKNASFPIDFQMIKKNTSRDKIFSKVLFFVRQGWPHRCPSTDLMPYFIRRNEISVEQGCLLWGYRLIVPAIFRDSILRELHSTHMGVVKMKAFARSYFWWPNLDEAIEKIAQGCSSCVMFSANPPKAPLMLWDYPNKIWTRLHADFFGPCLNKYFLVIEDATSKWLECFQINNYGSQTAINCFRRLFSRFGLPHEVCTDNGAAFCSGDFQEFLLQFGITHKTGAPYHPETNGLAESGVKIMKKALLKAHNDGVRDINLILDTFLFQYRNTPHTTTCESPAKLLFGRNLRTKFDLLLPSTQNLVQEKQNRIQKKFKRPHEVFFESGDVVWARDYREHSKKWIKGIVSQVLGRRTYIIEVDSGKTWKRHIDQLKKCYPDSNVDILPLSTLKNNSPTLPIIDEILDNQNIPGGSAGGVRENDNDSASRVLRRRSLIRQPDRLQLK